MIQAMLVDLDDTLLVNDVARFIPAYFDLLANDLSVFAPKDQVLTAILAGTKAMLGNENPELTLAAVFFGAFQSAVGADPAKVAAVLERFYRETYPALESLTRPKEGATELLHSARSMGLAVAVATNPLMILPAIGLRLTWAGASPDTFGYALVTDVETFHFAKPRLAYFAETLAYLGLLPSEAVMIGNDVEEDLKPSSSLGMSVFHVTSTPSDGHPGGDLTEAARWLAGRMKTETVSAIDPPTLVDRFEGQLAALLTRLDLIGGEGMHRPLPGGSLTPLEVVCHLRDVDREVNLPRLQTFLAQDDPFFSSIDTDDWIRERAYLREDPAAAVQGFVAVRRDVTAALRSLTPAAWQRRARHALFGPITLADWTAVLVEHDLRHQAQLQGPVTRRSPAADRA